MRGAAKRAVPHLVRLERKASPRNVVLLLCLLAGAAAAAALLAILLAAVAPGSRGARGALLVAIAAAVATAVALVAAQALTLRALARIASDVKAARAEVRQTSAATQRERAAGDATAKDLLESLRATAQSLQASMTATTEEQARMLTTVLEEVLDARARVEALQRSPMAAEQGLTKALEAARLRSFRQVQGLMALHTLLPLRRPLPALGDWAVSADAAASLVELVLERRPRVVLELGSGVSTVLFAYALESVGEGGTVVSIEHDEHYAAETRRALAVHGLSARASVVIAPIVTRTVEGRESTWYNLEPEQVPSGVEVLFVDGPPAASGPLARYPAVPLLWGRLALNADIVLDDADRPDEAEIIDRWTAAHPELTLRRLPHERGTAVLSRRA